MYKSQADAVKDWLQAYKRTEEDLDRKLERLRTLQARMRSVGAQELSDMPRPPSAPKDRMAEYVVQLDSLEAEIEREQRTLEACRQAIMDMTEQLQKKDACDLIRYRYVHGYEWGEVMSVLYGNEKDLYTKQNAYRRKMYRLHETALRELSKLWNKKRTRP